MHAEDFRRVLVGQLPDLLNPVLEVVLLLGLGQVVDATLAEVVVVDLVQFLVDEHAERALDHAVVQFFRHAAALGDFADHELDCVLGDLLFGTQVAKRVQTRGQV